MVRARWLALGGVPAVLGLAGGVLAGSYVEPRRKLPRVREAGGVADLGDQTERGQCPDPAKPGQELDLAGPPPRRPRDPLKARVDGGTAVTSSPTNPGQPRAICRDLAAYCRSPARGW